MDLDLFRYEDEDGDELILRPSASTPGSLMFHCDRDGARQSARVPREKVVRLRDTLDAWLAESGGYARPAPLTAADVRAIAAEVVAEALAQQGPRAVINNDAGFCRIPGCTLFPGTAEHFEHDPEPGDVGHPRPPVTLADALADPSPVSLDLLWSPPVVITPECGLCKAPWSDGHGQPGDPCTGAPKQLVGCTCGHSWRVHDEQVGCLRELEPGGHCTCGRTPPSAPEVQR